MKIKIGYCFSYAKAFMAVLATRRLQVITPTTAVSEGNKTLLSLSI
jgi:hypothetical protein